MDAGKEASWGVEIASGLAVVLARKIPSTALRADSSLRRQTAALRMTRSRSASEAPPRLEIGRRAPWQGVELRSTGPPGRLSP